MTDRGYKIGDVVTFELQWRRKDWWARLLRWLKIADLMEPDIQPSTWEVSYVFSEPSHDTKLEITNG